MTPIMTFQCTRAVPSSLTPLRRHIHSFIQLTAISRSQAGTVLGTGDTTMTSTVSVQDPPRAEPLSGPEDINPDMIYSYGVVK